MIGHRWVTKSLLAFELYVLLMCPGSMSAAGSVLWSPMISVVWPHDAQGNQADLATATAINVSVWPRNQVFCTQHPGLSIWMAKNNELAVPLGIEGQLSLRTMNGMTFPTLEFNDVGASLAAEPTAKYSLVTGTSVPFSNVWVHASDPRTYAPHPVVPNGFGSLNTPGFDTRIQIVWPHDAQGNPAPVEQGTLVNVAADIFIHGTLLSVPLDFEPDTYILQVAKDNDGLAQASSPWGKKTTYKVGTQTYPRWVFNDVPVQAGHQYHFAAYVYSGKILSPYSNIWTHAADARTVLPTPEAPPQCEP